MHRRRRWGLLAIALSATLVVAACGDSEDGGGASDTTVGSSSLSAGVANYDLSAERPLRFLVAVFDNENQVLAFGDLKLAFAYTGTKEKPAPPSRRFDTTAEYLPLPGQELPDDAAERDPRLSRPSDALGVYAARDVTFPAAGMWQVVAETGLPGDQARVQTTFEVAAQPGLPVPGQPAPPVDNPVYGDPGVPVKAIDSRAEDGQPLPAEALHRMSVADAISQRRPVMVVVATPVFCQSRFCGPITEAVEKLVPRYGDRMAFAHIEVYRDFQTTTLNDAAKPWISMPDGSALEPFVYVVGSDGVITERFDNVASDAELEAAARAVLGL